MKTFSTRWTLGFVLLFGSVPIFSLLGMSSIADIIINAYEGFINGISSLITKAVKFEELTISSDSLGMYWIFFIFIIISFVLSLLWTYWKRDPHPKEKIILFDISRYYLGIVLLIYGLNKVFKYQFPLPEPNIVYTQLGYITKDLLYWTTMGVSRSYTIFTGVLECIVGLLLFWRKTSKIGGLISFGLILNIVAINYSYDISVKLVATFLLLLSISIIVYHRKSLSRLLCSTGSDEGKDLLISKVEKPNIWIRVGKSIAFISLIIILFLPYIQANNFNDDEAIRPELHGAFAINKMILNGEIIPQEDQGWKRIFFHRHQYFIIQKENDSMQDFLLNIHDKIKQISVTDYYNNEIGSFLYTENVDSGLILKGIWQEDSLTFDLRPLPYKDLPIFRNEPDWISEY